MKEITFLTTIRYFYDPDITLSPFFSFLIQSSYELDNLAKRIMPKISKTEDAALQAGTVGFDGDIFKGTPSLKGLVDKYDVKLSADEQAFMDNQVEKLCSLLDDYQVARDRDMPEHVWEFLKTEKFFGMIIPKVVS